MSRETDKQERGSLQHAAEHERPHRRGSVLIYLVILFAAAFVLLLMSFLMQQRANREAMDNLQQTSDSTVQYLENLLEENQTLKEENAALKAQAEALEEELDEIIKSFYNGSKIRYIGATSLCHAFAHLSEEDKL